MSESGEGASVPPAAGPASGAAGVAFALVSAIGYGSTGLFAGWAYAAGGSTSQLLIARFIMSCAILILVEKILRGRTGPGWRARVGAFFLGFTAYAGMAGLYFTAIQRMGAGLSAILLYLYPALVCLAVWAVEGKAPDRLQGISILLAFSGTTLISWGGSGHVDVIGVSCAVGAAVVYTAYLMLSSRLLEALDPMEAAGAIFLGAFVSTTGVKALQGELAMPAAPAFWVAAIALTFFASLMPVTTMFAAIARIGVARTSLLSTIEPVVAGVLGVMFLGERFEPRQLLGAAFVLMSIAILEGFREPEARGRD